MLVSFTEILDAFELSVAEGLDDHQAIVCRQTGKIYQHSEFIALAEFNDDIDDDEKYVAIPDRREFGLGKPLTLDFACEFLPDDVDDVRYIFSKRGAYQKFKTLLVQRNALNPWHDFEAKATERALRELNEMTVTG